MPDIGMPPPPPQDVASQMKPSAPPDAGSAIGQFASQQMQPMVDIGLQVVELEPLLNQMALQIPSMAPATDQLLSEMKARMGAPGLGMAGMMGMGGMGGDPMAQGMGGPSGFPGQGGMAGAPPAGGPPPPMGQPNPMDTAASQGGLPPAQPQGGDMPGALPPEPGAQGPNGGPGGPIAMPQMPPTMGPMDLAMQLEVKLPALGAQDPTLLTSIQYFIAKMRQEVPKVLSGEQDSQQAALSVNNLAPTDGTLRQIPSTAA